MIRTQLYLTEAEKQALALLSAQTNRPQSEIIRDAIDEYISRQRPGQQVRALEAAFGMWKNREPIDVNKDRATWDRSF